MPLLPRAVWGALALFVALTACRKTEEGPEAVKTPAAARGTVETEAVASDLPGDAAVVVSVYDLASFWNRLKGTQLYAQLRSIPEVQRKLDPAQNPKLAQGLERFQATAGVPLNEETLFKTLGKKIQIGFYPNAGDPASQRVVLVADMGDKDALSSILNGLRTRGEGEGVKFKTESYKGVELTVATDPQGAVRGLYGFHKDKLIASSDQGGIEGAVEALDGGGATMAKDTLYGRALTHVGEANVTVFVRKSGTRGLIGAMEKAQQAAGDTAGARTERMLEAMDKYNIQSAFVAGSNWTDEGLLVRSYSVFDPAAPGANPLREMLSTAPSEVEVVGYFPDSTLGFYAVNFLDAPKIYEFAVSYIKDAAGAGAAPDAGGEAGASLDQAIAEFERQTGMSIRDDILSWMGKEAALGLNGVVKGGFFPVPELSLAIQATDVARAQAFFTKLEAQLVKTMESSQQGFPLQFQEEDYKGVKVRYAPTPLGEGLAPAYAFHDDYVLVALSNGTLKRMLNAKTGGGQSVGSNAQFKALSDFFPGEANVVGYANTLQLFNEIGSLVSTFQQMSGQQASAETQDTVTRTIEALKNIRAVGAYGVNDKAGVEQRFLVKVQ